MKANSTRMIKKIISSLSLATFMLLFSSMTSASLVPQKEGVHTLVLIDDWSLVQSHSIFFDQLRKDGHQLEFSSAIPSPSIRYYDEFLYDNIILMAPSIKGKLLNKILKFFRIEITNCNQRIN